MKSGAKESYSLPANVTESLSSQLAMLFEGFV
jgi:hypothetical protein